MLTVILHGVVFLLGLVLVFFVLSSAIRSFVVPRSTNDRLARIVFVSSRLLFNQLMRLASSYAGRDRIMVYYAPVTLLLLPAVWLSCVLVGYTGMFWPLSDT